MSGEEVHKKTGGLILIFDYTPFVFIRADWKVGLSFFWNWRGLQSYGVKDDHFN